MKTDSQLQQDVMAELQWEPAVPATLIGVEVRDGVVTLSGEVNSYAEKLAAEQAAQRVPGVQALAIDVEVRIPDSGRRTDTDIAGAARNVLGWATLLPPDSVHVMVEGGWITLTGDVEWQFQRLAAADCLRYLAGVTGISNKIEIKPMPKAGVIKSDIEAAIKRRAAADAGAVRVHVNGGDVTLSGKVRNWAERDLVNRSAWGSPGVREVVDHMTIG